MRLMIRAAFFISSQASYIFSALSAIPLPIGQGGGEGILMYPICIPLYFAVS